MKRIFILFLLVLSNISGNTQDLRAPAYPLITHDPYLSIWSFGDTLNQTQTKHWTGVEQPISGVVKVDGQAYQFLGTPPSQKEYILPTAGKTPYHVTYTYSQPGEGWEQPTSSTDGWTKGPAPYDTVKDSSIPPRTKFQQEVWYKREFTVNNTNFENPQLYISHDSQVEVYLNGVKVFESPRRRQFTMKQLSPEALKTLKPGKNILAVHSMARQTGTYIDAGLIDEHALAKPLPTIQKSVKLTATQTIYTLTCGKADVTVTFTSPLLMDELEVLSRPASYITYDVQSNDGKSHKVQVLLGISGTISSNYPTQEVEIKNYDRDKVLIQSVGTRSQKILATKGDDVRIDWGYAYLVAPAATNIGATTNNKNGLVSFINNKSSAGINQSGKSLMAEESFLGIIADMGNVMNKKSGHVIIAYDDLYSVQYFGKNLKSWWKRQNEMNADKMIASAEKDYTRLMMKCSSFDKKLYQDAVNSGGKEYADLCQLAYRQAIAAHKVVARDDSTLLFFSKENFSNGSIGTVDVTYPSAPLFLIYNPELLKGMLRFIFEYSESGQFKKPFAAHDVGTYPIANGQTYREDMPVEESGNMLILTAAIAKVENNAAFAKEHWETLTTWAEYLKKEGFDPATQLSTDDFAGHLARNANLSVKAIIGLASYGMLAGMLGKNDVEREYVNLAREMAKKWMVLAKEDDHYTLAFEAKGTWSQKYNLVWDKILKLDIFPKSVARDEIAYYKTKQQPYGLPLDSRKTYTKSDWIVWTATLTDNPADFTTFIYPVWKFANETPDRIPLTDWHETTNAKSVGFRARSVVGGYFIKILNDKLK
ncbi:MAG TPA: DUF4965 domain-containing protein [Segetibacter sp.]|nr:DUF4965 domain-containing protein [Segetibacter sp.]